VQRRAGSGSGVNLRAERESDERFVST